MTRANVAREKLWKSLTCRTGLPGFSHWKTRNKNFNMSEEQ
jgi:hypothetical protein